MGGMWRPSYADLLFDVSILAPIPSSINYVAVEGMKIRQYSVYLLNRRGCGDDRGVAAMTALP